MTYQAWIDAGHSPFEWRDPDGHTLTELIAMGRDPEEEGPADAADSDAAEPNASPEPVGA